MGLPVEEIERLGLTRARGKMRFITATGPQDFDTYLGWVTLGGEGATVTVIPQPMPVMGYEVLENLRYKVNPVTRKLEKISDDENGGPVAL
jgi:predicted aspartyl protease